MVCVESLHINLNRIMLLAVGLWPYQRSRLVRVQLSILFAILTSFIIFQLTAFMTLKCTLDLIVDVLSSTLFFSTFVIKYSSFSIDIEGVKCLLEELQHIYNQVKDENEISILKKYGNYAKLYTAIFMLVAMFVTFTSVLYIVCPSILNIFLPTNESRHPSVFFVTEYFIDKEKYVYLLTLHEHMAFMIGGFSMIATGGILIVCQQYACGMFRIASYRLEQAMAICSLQNNKENLVYTRLVSAVDMHRKALKLSESSISRFNLTFFFMIIVGVIDGSLNYFRVFRVVSYGFDIKKLIAPVICVLIHFSYMSIGCYIAQEITDYNNDVFITVYSVQWYLAPLHTQKMILFLLQKGRNAFYLTCGGIFVGSLETAASLLSTSVSYFTVIYSTRQ